MGSVDDVLRRALELRASLGGNAPAERDVQVVVRARVRDAAVLDELVLDDLDAIRRNWSALEPVLAGTPAAAPEPAPAPAPLKEPESASETSGIPARVQARLDRIEQWYSESRTGKGVGKATDAQLRKIAESNAESESDLRFLGGFARSNARDLSKLLKDVKSNVAGLAQTSSEAPATTEPMPDAAPAPEAAQSPSTEPHLDAPPSGGSRQSETSLDGFAEFDWSLERDPALHQIAFIPLEEPAGLELSWPTPPTPDGVSIYRVVSNNEYEPIAPTVEETLVATYDGRHQDFRAPGSAVRHYAVFVNHGATEALARQSQPVLHATGPCVLPVQALEVVEDEGSVIGRWEVHPAVARIDVLRVPVAHAQEAGYQFRFPLPPEAVDTNGFVDHDATPGEEYEYRVYAVGKVGEESEELSPALARRVRLHAVLDRVTDLEVSPNAEVPNTYDVSWTRPRIGKVEIYRSQTPPDSGMDKTTLDRFALTNAGLTRDMLVGRPVSVQDDKHVMTAVPWPAGWSKAYFSPVTVLNDEHVVVGQSEIMTRTVPVSEVRLVERVDEQFVTFAWPQDGAQVLIFMGATGSTLGDPRAQTPFAEISQEAYEQLGGVHLPQPLPNEGCALHVVAASYSAARAVYSEPVTVLYDGLARIRYRFVAEVRQQGKFKKNEVTLPPRLEVVSDLTLNNIALALVHNPTRLPLYVHDGQVVSRRSMTLPTNNPQVFAEEVTRPRGGFLRLFVDLGAADADRAHTLAVLDPSVGELKCP